VVLWLLGRSPRMTRWDRADGDMWKRYPHLVVVLRRLPGEVLPPSFVPARMVSPTAPIPANPAPTS
jgi:hypothetical protein